MKTDFKRNLSLRIYGLYVCQTLQSTSHLTGRLDLKKQNKKSNLLNRQNDNSRICVTLLQCKRMELCCHSIFHLCVKIGGLDASNNINLNSILKFCMQQELQATMLYKDSSFIKASWGLFFCQYYVFWAIKDHY